MKKLSWCLLILVVACAAGAGCWQAYQWHLSGDLRRTLVAAADPSCSEIDLRAYIRDAQLQVRTKKDRIALADFENAVDLTFDYEQQDSDALNQSEADMLKEAADCNDALSIQCGQDLERYQKQRAQNEASRKLSSDEAVAAKKAYSAFLVDIGRKPLVE